MAKTVGNLSNGVVQQQEPPWANSTEQQFASLDEESLERLYPVRAVGRKPADDGPRISVGRKADIVKLDLVHPE